MTRAGSLSLLLPVLVLGLPHPDGPPPAHTGGFGEPTCTDCHADFEVNEGPGGLVLTGFPERISPGAVYDLKVFLRHEGMARAGFQLSARTPDGAQAGRLAPVSDRTATATEDGIEYAGHTEAGSFAAGDSAAWTVRWTAPDSIAGDLVVHVTANAANGDDSPFEDWVYAGAWTLGIH